MDYYLNGYTIEQINCIDMMIARVVGQFNSDNYYYAFVGARLLIGIPSYTN